MTVMSEHSSEYEGWLRELAEALKEPRTVPSDVVRAAYGAYAWRSLEAELAELTFDSRAENPALAGSRADRSGPRALTFAGDGLTIELEVGPSGVDGQLVPPQSAEVSVMEEGGDVSVQVADDLGCFRIDPVPARPFLVRVRRDRPAAGPALSVGRLLSTGWIVP
jgi:hypothetical protein